MSLFYVLCTKTRASSFLYPACLCDLIGSGFDSFLFGFGISVLHECTLPRRLSWCLSLRVTFHFQFYHICRKMSICSIIFNDFLSFDAVLFPSAFSFAKAAESAVVIEAEDVTADMHVPGLIQRRHRILASPARGFGVWIFCGFIVRNILEQPFKESVKYGDRQFSLLYRFFGFRKCKYLSF